MIYKNNYGYIISMKNYKQNGKLYRLAIDFQ